VAVVLTVVTNKNKYTKTEQYKNPRNTSTHITKNTLTIVKTPTYYKTHAYTHPYITKPAYTHTLTLQNLYINSHITKPIHRLTHYKTNT